VKISKSDYFVLKGYFFIKKSCSKGLVDVLFLQDCL